MLTAADFFDLSSFEHASLFQPEEPVWAALARLKPYMDSLAFPQLAGETISDARPLSETLIIHQDKVLSIEDCEIEWGDATKGKLKVFKNGEDLVGASVLMAGAIVIGRRIRIGKGVLVESGALIKAPTVIGDQTEVRQGAYLRGYCLVGRRCVVGHVTEVKSAVFLDDAKAGHFAYLGDSILGNKVNLGAGTKMANLRFISGDVPVRTPTGIVASGLKKFGAILGDQVQTGCNSVTNPGVLLGRKAMVFPNTTVGSGYHANGAIIR